MSYQSDELEYDAVHLRRGDFAQFRPETQWHGAALQARVERALPGTAPLLVACVVGADETDPFPELAASLPRRVVRTDELYGPRHGVLHRAVVDSLVLALARSFVGTPDSTFSTGVWHWRALRQLDRGQPVEEPRALEGAAAGGECWQNASTFAALR